MRSRCLRSSGYPTDDCVLDFPLENLAEEVGDGLQVLVLLDFIQNAKHVRENADFVAYSSVRRRPRQRIFGQHLALILIRFRF